MRPIKGFILILLVLILAVSAWAYDGVVEKKVFTMASYTTVGGQTIKNVRVGYETYGSLNANKDNAILIAHGFPGTSHAAGKYKSTDPRPGYWDSIIGSGKPVDTDKFFVISSDTLVNLNVKDPNVITTGPASINPDTGKPYGMGFPIVTIRDFVNVQKALVDALGIKRLHAVMGPSMGGYQTFEWGAAYPEMVERIIPVIATADYGAYGIANMNIRATAVMLDPKWNKGDYYGKEEPTAGLTLALKLSTFLARHYGWASKTYGRKWATADQDPAKSWDNKFAIEEALEKFAAGRAKVSDANSLLYLSKAVQLFVTGHKGSLEEGLKDVRAKVLLIPAKSDLLVFADSSKVAFEVLKKHGKHVEYFEIEGDGGHLDGIFAIAKAAEVIRKFLNE